MSVICAIAGGWVQPTRQPRNVDTIVTNNWSRKVKIPNIETAQYTSLCHLSCNYSCAVLPVTYFRNWVVYGLGACKCTVRFLANASRQGQSSLLSNGYQRPEPVANCSPLLGSGGQERLQLHLWMTAKANVWLQSQSWCGSCVGWFWCAYVWRCACWRGAGVTCIIQEGGSSPCVLISTKWNWMVSFTLRLSAMEEFSLYIGWETGWSPEPVRTLWIETFCPYQESNSESSNSSALASRYLSNKVAFHSDGNHRISSIQIMLLNPTTYCRYH